MSKLAGRRQSNAVGKRWAGASSLLFVIALMPRFLAGQAEISGADIHGVVRDNAGAAIQAQTVRLYQPDTGGVRTTSADAEGQFRFLNVVPARYEIEFMCEGCPATRVQGIEVRIGETYELEVEIDRRRAADSPVFVVDVTDKLPVIDAARTQQANTIDAVRIRALPINRRNYLDFALLAPGVLDASSLTDDTDFRVAQSPSSGLSIGANNGRGNGFSVDGLSNDYNSGGVRPSVSQEAIQEFQVNRSGYTAEFGGALGATLNIVSRSGGNQFHGNLFGFLRHRSLQARNYFDSTKSPYTRVQWGATAGGAIRRDRTYFFAAFEQLDRQETVFVPLLADPGLLTRLPAAQDQVLQFLTQSGSPDFAALAAGLRPALIPASYPSTVKLFQANSGNFPFGERTTQGSLRLDHRFSERRTGFFRTAFTDSFADRTQFGAQITPSRGRSNSLFDGGAAAVHTWTPGAWLVETRAAFGFNRFSLQPTDPYGPELNINGYGFFGRDLYLPSTDIERVYQLQQNFTRFFGKHVLKFGTNFNPVQDAIVTETLFGGQFAFGDVIPFGAFLDLASGVPNLSQTLAGAFNSLKRPDLVTDLQAPLSALQAFSLGLPTYYQQGFGQPSWNGWARRWSSFVQDSWTPRPGLKLDFGLRYELELKTGPIHNEKNNVAPRFGFAYSPNAKTVVRGGYGLFYSPINAMYPYIAEIFGEEKVYTTLVPLTGLPGTVNPKTGAPVTSADIFQTIAGKGILGTRSISAADLVPLGLSPRPGMPLRVRFALDPAFRNPYSHQASLEVERALGAWSLSAAYNFNRGLHIGRATDSNLVLTGRQPDGRPIFTFRQPDVLQFNLYQSTANSYYDAGVFQVSRRLTGGFSMLLHYTFSKAIDDVTDFVADYQPQDQSNLRGERALSSFHHAHRLGANAVWQIQRGGPVLKGFVVSGIFEATSGAPFNLLTGFDNIGDNHATNHRPWGLGRNTGRGPGYSSTSLRLSREFALDTDGKRQIQWIGEVFNVFNRTNFLTVNNTVGTMALPDLLGDVHGLRIPVTQPLAFTSAHDPRQFQLGLKFLF